MYYIYIGVCGGGVAAKLKTNVLAFFCRNTGAKSQVQQNKQHNKNTIRNIAGTI